jgi:Na+-translocating ferredoxin:NAD+ oxidoreductase subunit D
VTETMLVVSASPHLREGDSIARIMWGVVLALLPAAAFGMAAFGWPAVLAVALSIAGAVGSEALILAWQRKPQTIADGSAFLTGLLLAMCLPPSVPWYLPLLGSASAIGIAKFAFGGLGQNVFNPAHVGRAVLMSSYPIAMTAWAAPGILAGHFGAAADALSGATPLGALKLHGAEAAYALFGGRGQAYQALLLGLRGGCIGETSTLLLLAGGAYLIARKWIKWEVPAVMIGTVGALTWAFGGKAGPFSGDGLLHAMSGGLVLGAFFMATDMVTIPTRKKGQILFAFGCGVLTVLIRLAGGYPEGVCYAILIMNAFTPLIEKAVKPPKYGSVAVFPKGARHAG